MLSAKVVHATATLAMSLSAVLATGSTQALALEAPIESGARGLFYNFPVSPFALTKGKADVAGGYMSYSSQLTVQPNGGNLFLSGRSFFYGSHSSFGRSYDFNLANGVIQAAYMSPESDEPTPGNQGQFITPPTSGNGYFEYLNAVRGLRSDLVGSHAPAQAVSYLDQVETVVGHLTGIYAVQDSHERGYASSATPISFSALAANDCEALVDVLTVGNQWLTGTRLAVQGGEVRALFATLDLARLAEGPYKLSIKLVPTGGDWTTKLSEDISDFYVLQKR